jgi:hypothetical protein
MSLATATGAFARWLVRIITLLFVIASPRNEGVAIQLVSLCYVHHENTAGFHR